MLHDLGYDGVELGSFGAHPDAGVPPHQGGPAALKKDVADHGLEFSGIAVDLWSFKKPGPSILDENPTPLRRGVSRVYRLRAPTWGSRPSASMRSSRRTSCRPRRWTRKQGMDRLIQVWDKCSKIAADYGMNVCWEFEPGFAFNKPSEVLKIVDGGRATRATPTSASSTTPAMPTCAPPSAPTSVGDKETLPGGELELLEKLKGKITHVHLIDSDGSLNEHNTSTHNPFGTGKLNFDKLAPGAEQAGVPQRLVVRRSVLLAQGLERDRRQQAVSGQAAGQVCGVRGQKAFTPIVGVPALAG